MPLWTPRRWPLDPDEGLSPQRFRGHAVGTAEQSGRLLRPIRSAASAAAPEPAEVLVKLSIGSCEAFEVDPGTYFALWGARTALPEVVTGTTTLAFLGTGFTGIGVGIGSLSILLDCPNLEYDPMIAAWQPGYSYTTGDKVQPTWNVTGYPNCPTWPGYMEATCDFVSGAVEPGPGVWSLTEGGLTDDDVTVGAWLTHSGSDPNSGKHTVTTLPNGPVAGPTILWDSITTYRWMLEANAAGMGVSAPSGAPVWFGNPDA